jgi:hypothetical protein
VYFILADVYLLFNKIGNSLVGLKKNIEYGSRRDFKVPFSTLHVGVGGETGMGYKAGGSIRSRASRNSNAVKPAERLEYPERINSSLVCSKSTKQSNSSVICIRKRWGGGGGWFLV